MMLLYKAWRESRSRFIGSCSYFAVYCCFVLGFRSGNGCSLSALGLVGHSWVEYIKNVIWGSFGKIVFVLPVIFLGLGGLLRERAHRTAIFSLSLPVGRPQLVGAHLAAGLATEVADWPSCLSGSFNLSRGLSTSLTPSKTHCGTLFLRFISGAFIFAIAFLLSVILKGEYTAPIACYLALLVQARMSSIEVLREYWLNPLVVMDNRRLGPSPWVGLSIMVLTSMVLVIAATRITQAQKPEELLKEGDARRKFNRSLQRLLAIRCWSPTELRRLPRSRRHRRSHSKWQQSNPSAPLDPAVPEGRHRRTSAPGIRRLAGRYRNGAALRADLQRLPAQAVSGLRARLGRNTNFDIQARIPAGATLFTNESAQALLAERRGLHVPAREQKSSPYTPS